MQLQGAGGLTRGRAKHLGKRLPLANFPRSMTRLVSSIFAVALAVSFIGCEGHSVDSLPPHYQHKLHHGDHQAAKPAGQLEGESKDPNRKHEEVAIPANPEAKPGGNPVKKH